MQTIATDITVCLSGGFFRLWCAKTAERIEVLFGVKTFGGPRNIVLDRAPVPAERVGWGSTFDAAFAKLL